MFLGEWFKKARGPCLESSETSIVPTADLESVSGSEARPHIELLSSYTICETCLSQ